MSYTRIPSTRPGRIFSPRQAVRVSAPQSSILSGWTYLHHWRLEEASGAAADSVGGVSLSATNSPLGTTGKIGTCREFVSASAQRLQASSVASLQTGDVSFEVCFWTKLSVGAQFGFLASKIGTDQAEWLIYINFASPRFEVFHDGTFTQANVQDTGISLGTDDWHFVDCYYDAVANEIGIRIDDRSWVTASTASVTPKVGTAAFAVGGSDGGGNEFDGLIDELFYGIGRNLTTEERATLYNGGSGLAYPWA